MADAESLKAVLAAAVVDDAVFALRPDYRALLIAVDGIRAGGSDEVSEALLGTAEKAARSALSACELTELAHVAAWRDAYRSFGAKPQRTRNSLEALLRRAEVGLPRVNRLTDVYNAVSVIHQIPLGGEDLARYEGAPQLLRATGEEPFDTVADDHDVVEHPGPGEVVWCDDAGVTCRRWNWRQARRTQLSADTTTALFILDALGPVSDDALDAAADDLVAHIATFSPELVSSRRMITPAPTAQGA